jgi:hypothetical protein
MTPEENNLISGLFDRLAQANAQPKDAEAEQLIRSKVAQNPSAPYLLTQSTLVMQQALANAQNRIVDLEKQLNEAKSGQKSQSGGSFLSGVASFFGGGSSHGEPQQPSTPPPTPRPAGQTPPPPPVPQQPQQGYAPPPPPQYAPSPSGGGGFLQNALMTAAGVAGGALLFRGIENLIGHNPGPFAGSITPGGGFMGSGTPQEVVNNYYMEGSQAPGETRTADQGDPDPDSQYVSNQGDQDPDTRYAADQRDPDPDSQYVADQGDPDPDNQYADTTDYGSGGDDVGGDDNLA